VAKPSDTVSPSLQAAYDEQYSEESAPWRELCGKYKAENIAVVCGERRFRRVLECGAGEGSILKFLDASEFCDDLYAIEISGSGLRAIERRRISRLREARKFDGYTIPYPDDHFDLVYCSHVIEHVEHPRVLLRELSRVAPYQVFEVPIDYSPSVDTHYRHFHSYGHINVFTPATFRYLLKSEGFDVIADRYTYNAPEVIRYSWYKNMKMRFNWIGESKLLLWPIYRALRGMQLGQRLFRELEFSAYTCLVKRGGGLRVFEGGSGQLAAAHGSVSCAN
jgi:ubiquinone/menaquinone biosynthesis C-methylase UbiE